MTTSANPVRIGFVGVGNMGQCAHLRNYVTVPGCRVVAIAELREKTARLVAARYGIPKVYPDAAAMLRQEQLDGIVASQPFHRHGQIVPELAATKLPIFIEKPLASSIATAQKILTAVGAAGAPVMVGYHKRSDPATVWAKARIDEFKQTGELGRLTYVRLLMPAGDWIAGGFTDRIDGGDPTPALHGDPPPADLDAETAKKYSGFVNYYIHQVNLMRHLLGEAYQVTYAEPSGVLLVGRSAGGVPCTIEMTPYRTTVDWQESALVAFEKGYVKLSLPAPLATLRAGSVEVLRDPGNGATPIVESPQLPWVHAMRAQAENFVKVVRGKAPPPCAAPEALQDLEVAREYIRLLTGK